MKRSRTKLALLAFFGMMSVVNAWAQAVVKNTTTGTSYATLQEAFYDASQGDVIELLGDVDATGDEEFNDDFNLGIAAGITLEGNNHTLTVNRRGISVARQSSNSRRMGAPAKAPGNTINVTIQDLTIKNVAAQVKGRGGQIINTRGGIGTLTLNNVTFDTQGTAYNGNVRPLVIGGSQSTAATVNITNCTFTTPTALAINVFNPVTMNIEGTTINAQYVINLSGADSSYGSQGSEVTFNGSTVNASAGAAVLFDFDDTGSGANGSTVTLTGETKVTTPTADWYDLGNTENTIVWEHFATNYISATKYETKPTIQIATVADLQALATLCNNALTSGQTAGNTYELVNDLDLSSVDNWTPIGGSGMGSYPSIAFKGTFDGKNHIISNLTCIDNTANYATAGLFGSVVDATIKNLTLKDVNIESTHFAGALVAYEAACYKNGNTIENCHVEGGTLTSRPELINGSWDNGNHVGGILGHSQSGKMTITGCSVEGVVITGYRDLGGLAGYVAGGTVTGNTVKDVTIIQNDENGYKTNSDGSLQDLSNTLGEVVGGRSGDAVIAQANDPSKNVANNVTIESTGVLAKIGEAKFSTVSAAVAAATEGQTVEIYVADTYTLPNLPKNITIEGKVDGVVFSHTSAGNIASVPNGATFKNVTFNFGSVNYHGFQQAGTINMEGCTLNGKFFSYGDMNFDGCTFNAPGTEESGYTAEPDYSMWAYSGNLTYTNCTFNCKGKCINVYNEGGATLYTVTAQNCTFNSETANKAAFNVKATCGTTPLKYKVIIEDCEATGNWPAASESEALVVLNALAQVDDINSEVASDIEVIEIKNGVETVLYTTRIAEYDGTRYNTLAEALDAAEAAGDNNIVINLLNDATLDITAWNGTQNALSIGTAETESITINGNNKKLTFNQKNSDWNNVATMNDAQTKLTLKDMNITSSGYNNGPWNRHDINFNCAVELNNVVSDKALAFKNAATLKNVTITDTGDIYGIWIQPNGQAVSIDGLNLTCGRGIKIDDQYLDEPELTTLNIANATFETTAKSAILVKSAANTVITAGENIHIENVAADNTNLVWVDENRAEEYYKVTTTGATMVPEKLAQYVATLVRGEQTRGYYKTFAAAYNSTDYQDGDSYELLKSTTETVVVDKELTIVKNGCTAENLTAGEDYTKNETEEEITFVELPNVAQIGETGYKTLQKAVDAAQALGGAQTITLLGDISGETVTIKEVANFQLTIDGQNKTVDATIVVDGLRGNGGSTTNGASVTLQNIAFVKTTATDGIQASHYPHHLTIQDCTYAGFDNDKWFFNASVDGPLYGVTIKDVTVENARLIYANLADGAVFQNITATTNCKVGFNVKSSGTVLIENCQVTTDKYAFRDYTDGYEGTFTLKDNTFISTSTASDEGVIVNRGGADGTAHINVESGTYTGQITVLNGKTALNITGGTFTVEVPSEYIAEDYGLTDNGDGTYTVSELPNVAQIGETGYKSLQKALDAVAKAYDTATEVTINIIRDIDEETVTVKEYKNFKVTIDGANTGNAGNYKFSGQMVLDGMRTAGGSISNGASITLQNIAFVQSANKDAITSPANSYTHHVTIQNCTYEGNAEWTGTWFVNMLDVAYYFNINNITAKNTRLLSGKGFNKYNEEGYGLVLEDVTATEGITAVFNNIKTNGEVVIQNNTIVATKYVLRDAPEAYEGTITLKDNNFTTTTEEADEGVIYTRRPADTTPHILVESGIYVGKLAQKTENHVVAISGGHFSVDLSQDAYKDFIANLYYGESNLYPETPEAPNGVKNCPIVIVGAEAETGYTTFAEAVAAVQDGETIKILENVEMAADLTSTLQDGESFTITFGDYSITQNGFFLKLNTGVSVTTDKETDLFAPVNATDMITVSGTYTYTAVSKESQGIFELVDGTACPYALESDVLAEKITYTRTIAENRIGNYQPWFVPFDYTITDDDAENFTFYKINMIANSPNEGVVEESDKIWIFLTSMNVGDVLRGNKPYIFVPQKADDFVFTVENTTLKAKDEGVLVSTETVKNKYSFYGTYANYTLKPSDPERGYYMTAKGALSFPEKSNQTIGSYRWYLRVSTKGGLDYAREINFTDDAETQGVRFTVNDNAKEAYYTLDGVRVKNPGKGVYIKRYADGTTKKITIK